MKIACLFPPQHTFKFLESISSKGGKDITCFRFPWVMTTANSPQHVQDAGSSQGHCLTDQWRPGRLAEEGPESLRGQVNCRNPQRAQVGAVVHVERGQPASPRPGECQGVFTPTYPTPGPRLLLTMVMLLT